MRYLSMFGKVVLLASVSSACALDQVPAESEEPVEAQGAAVTKGAADPNREGATSSERVNLDLSCFRNPPPIPGYQNVEGFIIDCINAGGEGVCMMGQPTCCKNNGSVRVCTQDPRTLSLGGWDEGPGRPDAADAPDESSPKFSLP